jgi:hypothetical protein
MTGVFTDSIDVRAAEPSDLPAILDLLGSTLGWVTDGWFDAFYAWKHQQNPFGASLSWVAVDGEVIVGHRVFLRWEHVTPDGEVLRTVRAVDTATRPSHQRRGIFRRLNVHAVNEVSSERVAFVFNTPNDSSRAGNLKVGWSQVGRLGVGVRVASPLSALRVARARVPADIWSVPSTAGQPAPDVLASSAVRDLLDARSPVSGLATHRTPAYLRWRYGFKPLSYRAITLGDDVRDGLAIFRLRRRGPALECAVCEVLVPQGDRGADRALVRAVVRECGADYVVRLGCPPVGRDGFVRAPGQGPILTWRPLREAVPGGRLDDWALGLGDVELL